MVYCQLSLSTKGMKNGSKVYTMQYSPDELRFILCDRGAMDFGVANYARGRPQTFVQPPFLTRALLIQSGLF